MRTLYSNSAKALYYNECSTYLAAELNGLATSWDPPTNFAKLENSPNWLKNPHRLWLENKIRVAARSVFLRSMRRVKEQTPEPCSVPASSATSAIGFHSNRTAANRAAGRVWRHRLTHYGYWRHSPLAFSFVEATSAIVKSQKHRKR